MGGRDVLGSGLKSLVAALGCGGVAHWVARAGHWDHAGTDPGAAGMLLAAVAGGVAAYLLLAKLLKCKELGELAHALIRTK